MSINIIARIKPLYDELVRQHFLQFLETHQTEFNRLCITLDITTCYVQQAYNEATRQSPDEWNFLGSVFDYSRFLANLLNTLFSTTVFPPVASVRKRKSPTLFLKRVYSSLS